MRKTADPVLVAPNTKTGDLKKLGAASEAPTPIPPPTIAGCTAPRGRSDSIDNGERFQVKRIMVSPGANLSLQLHKHRAGHWVVVRGIAEVTRVDKVLRRTADESIFMPVGTPVAWPTLERSPRRLPESSRATTWLRTTPSAWTTATGALHYEKAH